MIIYVGHSSEFDYEKELYQPLRKSCLNSEHEIIFPHEKRGSFNSRDTIKKCDVMIAEVSLPSTGLGIELGWANTYKKPIICIYRKGMKISGSIKFICDNFIKYSDGEDMIDKIDHTLISVKRADCRHYRQQSV